MKKMKKIAALAFPQYRTMYLLLIPTLTPKNQHWIMPLKLSVRFMARAWSQAKKLMKDRAWISP